MVARPAEKRKAAAVGRRPGGDQVAITDPLDAADSAPPEVELDWRAEAGTPTGDHFAGVFERNEQRPLLRQRVAQTDQQCACGRRGQPFDV
jgi:hypothetical protein